MTRATYDVIATAYTVRGLQRYPAMLAAGGLGGVAQADMLALPPRSGGKAGLWCQAAMLHIPHAQVPQVLAEMARISAREARLHLVVADGDGERPAAVTLLLTRHPTRTGQWWRG